MGAMEEPLTAIVRVIEDEILLAHPKPAEKESLLWLPSGLTFGRAGQVQ
jgi:hypothetical protein